ncbi:MAG: pentapeptide repeat-containing protein [Caldilineaceae bacterium]|nr:pentapeptide repeat-containing protein [Caldilineaceae bacterium]
MSSFFAPILFVISFYIFFGIFVWIIWSLPRNWLDNLTQSGKIWIKWHRETSAKIITCIAFLGLSIGAYWLTKTSNEILFSLAPELIGTSCVILVIDALYRYWDEKQEKQRVIAQMRSPTNELALDAVRIAEDEGWLTDGSLKRVNLAAANLRDAKLSRANLEEARLVTTCLYHASLSEANLKGAEFIMTELGDARLYETNLQDATFIMASLRGAHLIHAQMQRVYISNTGLQNAYLNGADLSDAQIYSSDLSGTSLQHTILDRVMYDKFTTWPPGFDPKTVGGILVESDHKG